MRVCQFRHFGVVYGYYTRLQMHLGIIGLPLSGKTTIFNALTRGDQPTGKVGSGGRFQVHSAVVSVPDPRMDRLSAIYKPEKTIYAQVTYSDISGLEGEEPQAGQAPDGTAVELPSQRAGNTPFSGPLLNQLTQLDGFLHVVRVFEDDRAPHPSGSVEPERDLAIVDGEFLLNDLIAVERKLERLGEDARKGIQKDKQLAAREKELFERLHACLSAETPLRDTDLTPAEEKMLSGYGFLTIKPALVVFNTGEGQNAPEIALKYTQDHRRTASVALQGKLEMEIAQLPPEEAEPFLAEYGIEEPGLNRMIRLSYDLLGLQSFFTVGDDEVRAWTVRRGATAPEAAGEVHSDLQKGFIRAETFSYDDLMEAGSAAEVKARGKFRLEGKEYVVQDGDILTIRFNPRASS